MLLAVISKDKLYVLLGLLLRRVMEFISVSAEEAADRVWIGAVALGQGRGVEAWEAVTRLHWNLETEGLEMIQLNK